MTVSSLTCKWEMHDSSLSQANGIERMYRREREGEREGGREGGRVGGGGRRERGGWGGKEGGREDAI